MGNTVSKDGDREKAAAANRAAMPKFSAWVDSFRAVQPNGVRVLHADEGGKTLGAEPVYRTMNADQWLDYVNDPNPRPLGFQMERL